MENYYDQIQKLKEEGKNAALCVVTSTKGSTPRKTGAKMIVLENGSIYGTIGGGNLEKEVIKNAMGQLKLGQPKSFKHDLLQQHNMCCGGMMEIYIEPILTTSRLYIFGAGHTGEALAKLMADHEFDIYLIDDRPEFIDSITIDGVNKMKVPFDEVLSSLPFDNKTYIVIMTYSHPVDRNILSFCIKQPNAYLGMIGSKRKVEVTKKMFVQGKIGTPKELSKVDMPMGIDINANSPAEIALSIGARLIEVKNRKIK